jgi:hypothetical protein
VFRADHERRWMLGARSGKSKRAAGSSEGLCILSPP